MSSEEKDQSISKRKQDHIDLAFKSQMQPEELDRRFSYEPMLAAHPAENAKLPIQFEDKQLNFPIWVSSMTGGTEEAGQINKLLARVCGEFGFGMGLGSCRIILDSEERLPDFDVRDEIGKDLPLYANLGVAQVETLLADNSAWKIDRLLERLQADGLIIHVNPIQEWLQPEGDRFKRPPIMTVSVLLQFAEYPVIVKEVGQGIGEASLEALLKLPLAAIEFAAHGGTNFARLELLRNENTLLKTYADLARVGHNAETMVNMVNNLIEKLGNEVQCRQIIVSGGVKDFLDGYYYTKRLNLSAIYGQASAFLRHAKEGYEQLQNYARLQIAGLKLAHAFLRVTSNERSEE